MAKDKIGTAEAMGSAQCYKYMEKKTQKRKSSGKGNDSVINPTQKDMF